jgi:hypothetical protein
VVQVTISVATNGDSEGKRFEARSRDRPPGDDFDSKQFADDVDPGLKQRPRRRRIPISDPHGP